MSLVIALYTDSKRYALASDSRATSTPGGLHSEIIKAHRLGSSWLVGFSGGVVGGQRMIAEMLNTVDVTYCEEWQFDHGIIVPLHLLDPRDGEQLRVVHALLRSSPPVTDEGKRKVAEDDLRSKRYADAAALYEALNDVDGMAAAARGLASVNDAPAAIALLKKREAAANERIAIARTRFN